MMQITTTRSTITALWEDLSKPSLGCRPETVSRIVAGIVTTGWAANHQIADLLSAMGARMLTIPLRPSDFGVQQRDAFSRPARGAAYGAPHTAAADVAEFLIRLERLGLDIDPEPIVAALLPAVRKLRLLTQSELSVLWYAEERHRNQPVSMNAVQELAGVDHIQETVLPTGYVVDAWFFGEEIGRLTITPPKRRRQRAAA